MRDKAEWFASWRNAPDRIVRTMARETYEELQKLHMEE